VDLPLSSSNSTHLVLHCWPVRLQPSSNVIDYMVQWTSEIQKTVEFGSQEFFLYNETPLGAGDSSPVNNPSFSKDGNIGSFLRVNKSEEYVAQHKFCSKLFGVFTTFFVYHWPSMFKMHPPVTVRRNTTRIISKAVKTRFAVFLLLIGFQFFCNSEALSFYILLCSRFNFSFSGDKIQEPLHSYSCSQP
jgi:hypothetical protein